MRWIGGPAPTSPRRRCKLTEAAEDHHAAAPTGGARHGPTTESAAAPAAAADSTDDPSDSNTLAIIALIVGALGLAAPGGAVAMARGSRSAAR